MIATKASAWSLFVESACQVLADSGIDEMDVLPTSTSAELGLTSIEVMHLLIMIEDATRWELDFQSLLDGNGRYPTNMTIGALFDAIWNMAPPAGAAAAAGSSPA